MVRRDEEFTAGARVLLLLGRELIAWGVVSDLALPGIHGGLGRKGWAAGTFRFAIVARPRPAFILLLQLVLSAGLGKGFLGRQDLPKVVNGNLGVLALTFLLGG